MPETKVSEKLKKSDQATFFTLPKTLQFKLEGPSSKNLGGIDFEIIRAIIPPRKGFLNNFCSKQDIWMRSKALER